MSLRMLYQTQTLTKPPFPVHHLVTEPPLLASQCHRTFDDSPVVTCTIQIHRLKWFASNQAPSVDTRWLSYSKWQISSEVILVRTILFLSSARRVKSDAAARCLDKK